MLFTSFVAFVSWIYLSSLTICVATDSDSTSCLQSGAVHEHLAALQVIQSVANLRGYASLDLQATQLVLVLEVVLVDDGDQGVLDASNLLVVAAETLLALELAVMNGDDVSGAGVVELLQD